ncbi:MAG: phenylacetic acid degradation protein, partial [Schleiferiaceae bacterium]|nr:phenylacetic acid degradation protein [Schleiferiaceae bacterium]
MLNFFKKKKKKKDSLVAKESQHKTHHFHSLLVKDIKKETADCVSVAFSIPENLEEEFKFLPGQTLTLKSMINNEDVR